jgi:hypothetical protein
MGPTLVESFKEIPCTIKKINFGGSRVALNLKDDVQNSIVYKKNVRS